MKELKFKLTGVAVPVTLELSDGATQTLEIREMSAAAREQYLDALSGRMSRDEKGEAVRVTKFDGFHASLLSRCLYRGEKLVESKEIQAWPSSIVSDLFTAAQEINRLGKSEGEPIKNG